MKSYNEWEDDVPESIKGDLLWKIKVYRLGLFAADIGWFDVTKLSKDRRTIKLSDQLYRSLGSISANIAEGFSRSSRKDQARFFEYALGSARESRDWYFKGKYILGNKVVEHRMQLITEIIRLLLTMIPRNRSSSIREEPITYQVHELNVLMDDIPY